MPLKKSVLDYQKDSVKFMINQRETKNNTQQHERKDLQRFAAANLKRRRLATFINILPLKSNKLQEYFKWLIMKTDNFEFTNLKLQRCLKISI